MPDAGATALQGVERRSDLADGSTDTRQRCVRACRSYLDAPDKLRCAWAIAAPNEVEVELELGYEDPSGSNYCCRSKCGVE